MSGTQSQSHSYTMQHIPEASLLLHQLTKPHLLPNSTTILAVVMRAFSVKVIYIKKKNINLYQVNNDKNQYYLLQLSQKGDIMVEQMNKGTLSLNEICTSIVIHNPFSFNTCAFQRWLLVCRRYCLLKIYNS